MLYFNISSDKVHLSCNNDELFLERNGIEDTLGKVLVQWRRTFNFTKAFILNGPWGFTNLRVGSLCINLLNTLTEQHINLYSVSKIQLYEYAYKKAFLARYGVIYIGQKRNLWLWDFEKKEKVWQFTFEQLYKQWEESFFCNTFLDIVYTPNYYAEFLHNIPTIDYHHLRTRMETYLKEKQVQPTQTIEANYMIAPNIW